ncbi:hypothetical protein EXIGLDRAFT_735801 [Exidia glandulosa HHB12029]|uniref:Uncharacterized protein n=1 Tax=Exidia glandulosa HHB12029 TaxID=1314781 RepID=A0A166AU34_EXIGL|nr:hypothetical protein EXIGLDRAFT_735801 [Exidia glandulosa HHB12029]
MKGLPHVLATLLSFCASGFSRALRRNPCLLVLIALLSPWAWFLWQVHSHFGSLSVPLWRSRWPMPIQAPSTPTPVLLVTAFYPLSHAAHSPHQYRSWLANFLGRVTTDIYMYAPPDMENFIRGVRGSLPLHLNTSFPTVTDLPVLSTDVHDHAPWNSSARKLTNGVGVLRMLKPWFVSEALNHLSDSNRGVSGYGSAYRYAFWVDASLFREEHTFSDWPSLDRVDSLWSAAEELTGHHMDQLVFVPLSKAPTAEFRNWNPAQHSHTGPDWSEGFIFGGAPGAMQWFSTQFYTLLRDYASTPQSLPRSEQSIFDSLLLLFPDRFITTWTHTPTRESSDSDPRLELGDSERGDVCGDYISWWLGSEAERDEMNVRSSASKWRWAFWRDADICRVTGALSVNGVLEYSFGPGWTPPAAYLRHTLGAV